VKTTVGPFETFSKESAGFSHWLLEFLYIYTWQWWRPCVTRRQNNLSHGIRILSRIFIWRVRRSVKFVVLWIPEHRPNFCVYTAQFHAWEVSDIPRVTARNNHLCLALYLTSFYKIYNNLTYWFSNESFLSV